MSFWPSTTKSSRKAASSKKKTVSGLNYPLIEYGGLGAATLSKTRDDLEWKSFYRSQQGLLRAFNDPVEIFPRTRVEDVIDTNISLQQQVQHGTRFLRTHYPNLEIPIELISDELGFVRKLEQEQLEFDPFQGNILASAYCYESTKKKTICLIFPTGSLFRDLNLSPANLRQNDVLFQPSTRSSISFDTPISQICTSSPADSFRRRKSYFMAVRTLGSLLVYDIRNKTSTFLDKDKPPFLTANIMTIKTNETDGKKVVDMSFVNSDGADLFVITEKGVCFQCLQTPERKYVNKIIECPAEPESNFWRILGDSPYTGLITSERRIQKFDSRTGNGTINFLSYEENNHVITSLCRAKDEHLFCVTTTGQVIFVDDRYSNKPLLGWKHNRVFDRTLTSQCMDFQDASMTILSSLKNRHISAIGTVTREDSPIQCQLRPTSVSSPIPPGHNVLGRTIIRHTESSLSFSLLELSSQGSLYQQEFHYSPEGEPEREDGRQRFSFKWSPEIVALEAKSKNLKTDTGELAEREFILVDIDGFYMSSFGDDAKISRRDEEDRTAEDVFETLENMPFFWQRDDLDDDQLRTLYDVAYGSGKDLQYQARSDFLTGTTLNSLRGYRARRLNKIPIKEVVEGAAWHYNMEETLTRICPDVFKGFPREAEEYRTYSVDRKEEHPEAEKLESEACEQLALDLALSVDVFSTKKIGRPSTLTEDNHEEMTRTSSEADLALMQATEKLSLSQTKKKPPQVNFGFLHPVDNQELGSAPGLSMDIKEVKEAKMSLGVRLLLSEWTVGDDPSDYRYDDPYELDELDPSRYQSRSQQNRQQQPQERGEIEVNSFTRIPQTQAPPTVVAARSLAPALTKPKIPTVVGTSQSSTAPRIQVESQIETRAGFSQAQTEPLSSQPTMMAATQVLPGPFGGRQAVGKKKPTKKRKGGF